MKPRLLQVSGVVVDLLYAVDTVPGAGEEAIVRDFSVTPGGGFNAMVAARRAGMDVSYGGALGTGPFASLVAQSLEREGIPTLVQRDALRDQGCCTVMIDRSGERTFVASDGAEGQASAEVLARLSQRGFDWTLLSGYALHYKGSQAAIQDWLDAAESPGYMIFDPSPVVAALPTEALRAALRRATWISANRREAEVLSGCADPIEAAQVLARDRPAGGGAVVRDGSHGCVVATASHCDRVAAYSVSPVDTNGAGDTHLGSFVARLARGDEPIDAARYANVAAALSTMEWGPATAPSETIVTAAMHRDVAI
ncbi:MAG: PfkB family carbohydrate kinase [Pseudomonadota bacterium]